MEAADQSKTDKEADGQTNCRQDISSSGPPAARRPVVACVPTPPIAANLSPYYIWLRELAHPATRGGKDRPESAAGCLLLAGSFMQIRLFAPQSCSWIVVQTNESARNCLPPGGILRPTQAGPSLHVPQDGCVGGVGLAASGSCLLCLFVSHSSHFPHDNTVCPVLGMQGVPF